ncbi:MFS transporter, PAT family, beta-lactamase induction signal transducer AmpG [Nitrosomonas cryotolerans]|uniref:MFS transporter, PAT family, beta-lactamase induction signal transducer AmpG n=1 Tax=Nitrosomonas cryotolerans ATCC 49181 TaxID=1131553 RepID=A0A1N6JCK8_9PROT|nr:MFS transporter [Nitrosomonas cryotolerans]SFP49099.1 MFS transporter, PAT family, beta-lactamase induction signal transducer AmpG [Nitrosomonas cryotolerans]SIO42104.1 MFS transporter, PAT family, beta-lactamase induction signal transducer AmpG [Nitrosomonas cryotolerans ATCC 49181]
MNSVVPSGWLYALRIYTHPRVLGMLSLGFSAGLPLLLILGTLSFWLREAGIDRTTIGHLSWIGLAYGFKWLWAPLVDRLSLPVLTRLLGRRRAWLLFSQFLIMLALVGMACTDPLANLTQIVFFALAVAFASATQDIALDAYRIEAVAAELQGAMAATYQAGYRVAMILASAGVLWIAAAVDPSETTYHYAPWQLAYLIMAACMAVGMITTLIIREPRISIDKAVTENERYPQQAIANWNLNTPCTRILIWLYDALIAPFRDFIIRHGQQALLILALIAVYRISDVVMGVMSNPFYVDMGYTKDEIATVSKVYGVVMTIVGAAIGGVLVAKIGIMRTLFLGAVLSAATNLLFVWLAERGHDVGGLIFTISADNLSAGIASCAFIAYLSSLTNSAYSATQYALFSSIMLLLPKFIAGFSGQFVDAYGYINFFIGTALLGLPVLVLVWLAGQAKFQSIKAPLPNAKHDL